MAKNFSEIGTSGLNSFMGFINEAYHADLRWPAVQPLYSRIRRSDPEITVVREIFSTLARSVRLRWELPDDPSPEEKAFAEFGDQVLQDIAGGPDEFLQTMVTQVPFFGWGWWELVWGIRDPAWRAPGLDDWQSQYNDGRVGLRRFAWRDTSSFSSWDIDAAGRVRGMLQTNNQGLGFEKTYLPAARSLHIRFGDMHNPEGLSPLEAVWRLERYKYSLEIVQGMGFEHSAGYLSVTSTEEVTDADKSMVRAAARNVMTAQEGNYAFWPRGITGELIDTPFSAAGSILEAIKYYSMLKLMVFNLQWVAIATISGTGAYAASDSHVGVFYKTFNAMIEGFIQQVDSQFGRRLLEYNRGFFPGLQRRPRLVADPIEQGISLAELAQILQPIRDTLPLGDEDYKAIRQRTGFLPETLPEGTTTTPAPAGEPAGAQDQDESDETDPQEQELDPKQIKLNQALRRFRDWTQENDPEVYQYLKGRAE